MQRRLAVAFQHEDDIDDGAMLWCLVDSGLDVTLAQEIIASLNSSDPWEEASLLHFQSLRVHQSATYSMLCCCRAPFIMLALGLCFTSGEFNVYMLLSCVPFV